MRITNQMIINQVTFNLGRSLSSYLSMQGQISSGRRINKPSDDPIGITKALSYRTFLNELRQYRRNLDRAQTMLDFSDLELGSITESIREIEDIALQLQNETYDETARSAAASQVLDILDQIIESANRSNENRYLFAGSNTNTMPFDFNGIGVVYRGNNGDVNFEIDRGLSLAANIPGLEFLIKPVMTLGDGFDLNPAVARNTLLPNLHGGQGVNLGDNHFTLRTLNGEADIDLTGVVSIGDVIDAINTQAAAQGLVNLTVSISEIGNGLNFEDTSDPYITWKTPLSLLNQGTGVDLSVPGFKITDGIGTIYNVDLTGATDLQDVKNAIDAEAIPDLVVSLTPDGNSIVITDNSMVGHNYVIDDLPGGSAAEDLGIRTSTAIQGELVGKDLIPLMIQTGESAAGETTAADLGILFTSSFLIHQGDDINPRLTLNTKLSNLRNGLGVELSKIRLVIGHDSFDIDLSVLDSDPDAMIEDLFDLIRGGSGANVRMEINDNKSGITLESKVSGQSMVVYDIVENGAALQLGIAGSPDLIGSALYLRDGLEKNWRDTPQTVLDRLRGSQDQISTLRAVIGSRINRVDSVYSKNLSNEIYTTELLSDVEDLDMVWAITEMATREAVYQAALAASAQIIQPSLVNFLS